MHPRTLPSALALTAAASLLIAGPSEGQETAPQIESITAADLRADLFFLAGDEMRGREADSPEAEIAAAFIKSRFERSGLAPGGANGSYYHPFVVTTADLGEANRLRVQFGAGSSLTLGTREDFYPLRESASGSAEGELTFVGFGISDEGAGWHDYADADVDGRVVLVLDHEPGEMDPESALDGLVAAESSRSYRKILAAQEAGAIAVLLVSDVHNHGASANFQGEAERFWPESYPRGRRYTLASRVDRIRIPAVKVSPTVAGQLVESAGRTLQELASASETAGASVTELPGVRVEVETEVHQSRTTTRNVLGLVEGADPNLKDEWILITAHFDHDGAYGGQIFNGADDDGSGTVALLELAEAFAEAAERGVRPRRSVLLAAWNFEEKGLLGAWAYTESPSHPLEQTVAVLNMDMIGRNEEVPEGGGGRFRGLDVQTAESNADAVNVLGTTRYAGLNAELDRANEGIGLTLRKRYDNHSLQLLRRSDHWPFMQEGVPALFYHAGLHPDYHRADDVPEKINYEKMEKIVRLVYQTSWNIAQREGRPVTN